MTATTPEPMIEIRLYGVLRERFGRSHWKMIRFPWEAGRALAATVPGFKAFAAQYAPGFRIVVNKRPIAADEELTHPFGAGTRIGIVPVVAGAAGAGKIIAGVALIGLSFIPGLNVPIIAGFGATFSSVAFNLGVSMLLGGVSQAIAGTPKAPTPSERPNNQPSYAFNGPVNVTAQGQCVPIAYGKRIRVGSVVISSGLSVAQLT